MAGKAGVSVREVMVEVTAGTKIETIQDLKKPEEFCTELSHNHFSTFP
jgi:hypothetical protein